MKPDETKALSDRELIIEVIRWQAEKGPKIDDTHRSLFGNGDIEKGLVVRVHDVEKVIENIKKASWIAIASVIAGLVGLGFALF
jgi:hypothetical protein